MSRTDRPGLGNSALSRCSHYNISYKDIPAQVAPQADSGHPAKHRLTTYPTGHAVTSWDGTRRGILARPWERYASFPWVIWQGSDKERQALPESVRPVEEKSEPGIRNAWAEGATR
jgi:hypothetical protein